MEHITFEQLAPGDKLYRLDYRDETHEHTVTRIVIDKCRGDVIVSFTPEMALQSATIGSLRLTRGFYCDRTFIMGTFATSRELLHISRKDYDKQKKPMPWEQ